MPLTPACIEGQVESLPNRLCEAFSQACSSSSPAHTTRYITEKQEVLRGLGLQILGLGLWTSGQPPVSRLLLGIEPVNASNIEAADDAKLRLRHGLEALDCIFFITAIFFSAGHVETPYSPPESPVSWVPYTVPPRSLQPKPDRTVVSDLAHRAMRFRDYKSLFTFAPSVPDPDARGSTSSVNYWTSCAGLGGKGVTSHLSSLVLKLLRCRQLHEEQVRIFRICQVERF
jgi:hypothetical protein